MSVFWNWRRVKPLSMNVVMTCSGCCRSETSKLEHVITEIPQVILNINSHSMLMNWMGFPLQGLGGGAPHLNLSKAFRKKNSLFFHGRSIHCRTVLT